MIDFSLIIAKFNYALVMALVSFVNNFVLIYQSLINLNVNDNFFNSLFSDDYISLAFIYLTIIAAILLVVFTIIKIVTSTYQGNLSINKVIASLLKGVLLLILLPFILRSLIYIINATFLSINNALNLSSSSFNELLPSLILKVMMNDNYIYEKLSLDEVLNYISLNKIDYLNVEIMSSLFDLSKFHYVYGFISIVIILLLVIVSSLLFIKKIFEVVLFYLASPIVCSYSIIDEDKYHKFLNGFIAKVISLSSSMIIYDIYFLVMPLISSLNLSSSSLINTLIQILFIWGGSLFLLSAPLYMDHFISGYSSNNHFKMFPYLARAKKGIVGASKLASSVALKTIGGNYLVEQMKKSHDLSSSIASLKEQRINVTNRSLFSKANKVVGPLTRSATLISGTISDFNKGGLLTVKANFKTRIKNIKDGNSYINKVE